MISSENSFPPHHLLSPPWREFVRNLKLHESWISWLTNPFSDRFFFCGQVNKMLLLTHIAPPIVVRIFGAAEVKSVYFVFFFFWPKPVPGPGKKCMSPIWTDSHNKSAVSVATGNRKNFKFVVWLNSNWRIQMALAIIFLDIYAERF